MNAAKIKELAAAYATLKTVPFHKADEMLAVLDKAPDDALKLIVEHKVKFLWGPARRRLIDRGILV